MARVRDLMGSGVSSGTAQATVNSSGTVTATGTGSQGAGLILSYANNNCVTAASLDTFVLPTVSQGSALGDQVFATVETSTSGVVYPGGAETIVGSASAVTIAQHKTGMFIRTSATNWGYLVTA